MSPRISDLLSDANGLTSSGAAPALRQNAVVRQDEMRLVHRGMAAPIVTTSSTSCTVASVSRRGNGSTGWACRHQRNLTGAVQTTVTPWTVVPRFRMLSSFKFFLVGWTLLSVRSRTRRPDATCHLVFHPRGHVRQTRDCAPDVRSCKRNSANSIHSCSPAVSRLTACISHGAMKLNPPFILATAPYPQLCAHAAQI